MKTVILHPNDNKELSFLVALLEKLNISFQIKEEQAAGNEEANLIKELYGSWKSEETGEELIREIYAARKESKREINL